MRYVVTHGHIFKNAGTTFDYALKKAFGRDFCDHRDDAAMRQGGARYLKEFILDQPGLKAISSHHLCNPLPVSNEFTCIPIYFVRNPIDRIVSVYSFERKQRGVSKGAQMASKLSLEDYVRWRMTPEAPKVISDYQTAYIGRDRNLRPDEAVGLDIFQRTLELVASNEAMIGTVERFDESFRYITKQLQAYFPGVNFRYKKKNIQNRRSSEEKLRAALDQLKPVLAEVVASNSYDMALYHAVDQRLNEISLHAENGDPNLSL